MLDKSTIKLAFIILLSLITILWVNVETKKKTEIINAQLVAEEIEVLVRKASKPVNLDHLRCLAANIYFEAGSEPFIGQVAVARVVMNRVKHGFASNPCKVVYQSHTVLDQDNPESTKKLCQFSWTCEDKSIPSSNNVRFKQAEDIARKVLSENKWDDLIPSNVLFFHNTAVNPGWAYRKIVTIGNHVFYGKGKKE